MIYVISIVFMLISMAVASRLKGKFAEYSKITIASGLSGKEIAEKMLRDNMIYDVKVISVEGELTDHYNPLKKTVNLSPDVYHGRHAAAAAVASHECGHAVQHAAAYGPLRLRSALVPIQNVSATVLNVVVLASIFGGAFLYGTFPIETILLIIIGCHAVITLFSLVTLPVEFDASKRALAWLDNTRMVSTREHELAKDALKWAAMTYVVAAIAALTTLLYFIMMLLGQRRRD